MEPMRIAIDANPIFLSRGGIGKYAYHLVQHLVRIDPESAYFLYNTATREQEAEGLRLGERSQVVCFPRALSSLRVRRDRIDVYHGTSYKVRACGKFGSVVTVHDLALARFPQFTKRLLGEWWPMRKARGTLRKATRIIAVSEQTARDIVEFYDISMEKIRVVYNGVGEEFFPCNDPEQMKMKFSLPHEDFLLNVGGGDPRKNVERLLSAFSILCRGDQPIALVLAGGLGNQLDPIRRKIADLRLEDKVVLTGHLSVPELRLLYSNARAFVFPSLYEGFGIPVLEAMACGAPVVASNGSSIPEIAGGAAILVDPSDEDALASAVEGILQDRSLGERLRSAGLQRAKAFSWEKAARETLAVYREIVQD
jgi:glycosyltransferase involved in cell wall biosynthesis